MTNEWSCLAHLSDRELLEEVQTLAARERDATARLIASLMELDSRRLYLGEGCSSLFTYCTQVLRLSEHAAYGRIEAARAARRFPIVLERLADGSVTLTTVCLLAPHLTPENHHDVLAAAHHKSKREVEQLVASLRPLPPVASVVRKLMSPPIITGHQDLISSEGPEALPALHASVTSARPAVIRPLAPQTYKIQFTMSREMHERLREAQNLMRHVVPDGDPAAIFDRALTLLLDDLHRSRHAATARPRRSSDTDETSRHIPAKVKRKVWARDGGQCAFIGANGRCTERGFLEYHHVVPYAAGGRTTVENLSLRCRAHNGHEAELFFGPLMVREARPDWVVTRSGPS
jgi:5-methylcytosine-specific restriction endonuclease McrA